jgi:hypothetical protein
MKFSQILLIFFLVARGMNHFAFAEDAPAPESAPAAPADAQVPKTETPKSADPQTSAPAPAAPAVDAAGSADEGEYEIDYEEEPEDEEGAEAKPTPKPKSGKKGKSGSTVGAEILGSRAKHRFTPILKSETKSVYKKDGKQLDVDTD